VLLLSLAGEGFLNSASALMVVVVVGAKVSPSKQVDNPRGVNVSAQDARRDETGSAGL